MMVLAEVLPGSPAAGSVAGAVSAGAGAVAVAVAVPAGAGAAAVTPSLFHVTEKALPPVSADGVASVTLLPDTMVRESGFSLPIGALSAVTAVKFTVPKFDSGSTFPFPLLGASAITSAEPSCAVFRVWSVFWVQPWVESVSVRVNAPPLLATTAALIASPGCTGLL